MRLLHFYCSHPLVEAATITLDEPTSHRIANVLRLNSGDQIQVFDGHGHEYLATIIELKKKRVQAKLEQSLAITAESPLNIHLGQALLRSQKMDLVLQKSVELGVSEITPIICEHINVKLSAEKITQRMAHWQQVIISACEQSGRNVLPVLNPPQLFTPWIERVPT